jgi:uncharacterized protein YxjI
MAGDHHPGGNERDVFLVKGKVFSIGDKLSFQDLEGRELAYIEQTIFSFKKLYAIYRDGLPFAEVVKELTFFKDLFTVDNDHSGSTGGTQGASNE